MGKIDLSKVELIIFGDFSVLTNTPFRDRQPLHMLPGRIEYLNHLRQQRAESGGPALRYAVTGIKGGVAFDLQKEPEAEAEVCWTAEQIGASAWRVCFAHPSPAEGFEKYANPDELKRRKPEPGMFEEIIAELRIPRECVLVVGTYADDCRAAKKAALAFQTTHDFFAEAERRYAAPAEQSVDDDFDPFL